jgi:thiamine-phosphate pyrophosphorylase
MTLIRAWNALESHPMPARFDLSLYLVTDPEMTAKRGLLETVADAVAGGVTMVQLRQKDGSAREMAEAGRALKSFLAPRKIPLIVNDRIDVAHAIGADGVHVGQNDLPPADARAMLGPNAIIGLSVTAGCQLDAFDAAVDYIGLGPIFPTGTKLDAAPALGDTPFGELRRRISLPVVAIGGITPDNAARAIASGADGIAVVSAICAAMDPCTAAHELRAVVDAALKSRCRPQLFP